MENALELHVWYDYKDFLVPSVYLIEDLHVLKSISEISALFLSSGILQFSAASCGFSPRTLIVRLIIFFTVFQLWRYKSNAATAIWTPQIVFFPHQLYWDL